jgi:hypothetical protein
MDERAQNPYQPPEKSESTSASGKVLLQVVCPRCGVTIRSGWRLAFPPLSGKYRCNACQTVWQLDLNMSATLRAVLTVRPLVALAVIYILVGKLFKDSKVDKATFEVLIWFNTKLPGSADYVLMLTFALFITVTLIVGLLCARSAFRLMYREGTLKELPSTDDTKKHQL